jgi:hypothetical protein
MKTVIYQGWRYDSDEKRPAKERWQGTRGGVVKTAPSETAMKKLIDGFNDYESEQRGRGMMPAMA